MSRKERKEAMWLKEMFKDADPMEYHWLLIAPNAHDSDAGTNLYAKENQTYIIQPHSSAIIDTGVHIAIPQGYFGDIRAKSGMMCKCDIISTGTIDSGYTGSIRVKLFNLGNRDFVIGGGEKISQLVITPYHREKLEIVNKLEETERGSKGFGSTGIY